MSNFKDFEKHIGSNPAFIGELLADPKAAMRKANITIDNAEDSRRIEAFIRLTQTHVNTAAALTGFKLKTTDDWGIGAGCCNGKALMQLK